MAYTTTPTSRKNHKLFHMILHLIALLSGIIGVIAVFKFHNESGIPHMYTFHSWIGLSTIILFGLQVKISMSHFIWHSSNFDSFNFDKLLEVIILQDVKIKKYNQKERLI